MSASSGDGGRLDVVVSNFCRHQLGLKVATRSKDGSMLWRQRKAAGYGGKVWKWW